mgnify:CR=1 FL=1
MKKLITFLLIAMLLLSLFVISVSAAEPTQAATEAATEAMPSEAPTTSKAEIPTQTQGTQITADLIIKLSKNALDWVNKYKTTIMSGASAFASLLLSFVVGKVFKPKLEEFSDKSSASIKEIETAFSEWKKEQNDKVAEMNRVLEEFKESTKQMIETYEKERADKHASDAAAEIDHELASLVHTLIMQSKVGINIKEEADRIYVDAERKIEALLGERGEHNGDGE